MFKTSFPGEGDGGPEDFLWRLLLRNLEKAFHLFLDATNRRGVAAALFALQPSASSLQPGVGRYRGAVCSVEEAAARERCMASMEDLSIVIREKA